VLTVLVLLLGGVAAAWIASGREPTLGALAHRFLDRLSELSGIDLAGPGEPTQPVRMVARTAPGVPPPHRQAPPAPTGLSAPVPPDPPPAVVVGPAETPSVASALPVGTAPVAPDLPSGKTSVVSQLQAQAPAAVVPILAQTPAAAAAPLTQTGVAILPPPAMSAPDAVAPIAQAASQAHGAAALAQLSRPPQAASLLVLRAVSNAWVQVRQKGGQLLLSRTLKAGETWPVPSEPDLILDAGNVEGLDLEVDGVSTRLTGAAGGVIHNVLLDGDLLRSGVVRAAH
jgi:cytoskeleton protein RodZ